MVNNNNGDDSKTYALHLEKMHAIVTNLTRNFFVTACDISNVCNDIGVNPGDIFSGMVSIPINFLSLLFINQDVQDEDIDLFIKNFGMELNRSLEYWRKMNNDKDDNNE
jgi:hypothetical protein